MPDFISEFVSALTASGFAVVKPIVADDKWHTCEAPGDKKPYYTGTYSLKIVSADFAVGCYFSRRDPDAKIKWHSKSEVKLTAAERKQIKQEIEAQQRKKEAEENAKQERIAERLTKYYKKQLPAEEHPYLEKKRVHPHNIKYRPKGKELIIPLYGSRGKIFSIQRITPSGGKYLFAGGRKQGCYFPLCSTKENLSIILLAEGFATGASIREATGLPVFIAFDSGNLKPVLITLRAKYPSSKFVICADNDAFTLNANKEPWNVGIEKASQAAASIGGAYVVAPNFEGLDQKDKPTDFNDLQALAGLETVKQQVMKIVDQVPAIAPEAGGGSSGTNAPNQPSAASSEIADGESQAGWEPDFEAEAANIDPWQGDFGMNYKVLGYNNGMYFYFPYKERQIVALSASAHTLPNLFRLDSLEAWQEKFGADGSNEKKIVMYATNALIGLAHHRGVFKEEDRVRGAGAWIDNGRKILHCGDCLYSDGQEIKFDKLQSDHTYVAAVKLMRPSQSALSNTEARALRNICEAVTWENKLSGSLLAGWLVIAPVCGALDFRPHIYINGEAESGKSTVLNKIIKPVLGRIAITYDGGTTEPAIRQEMNYDARPIVYDEAEKSSQMPAVLELARKASTGASVKKFGQGMMRARFCACFSAINPPVDKVADESRICFMTIKKNRKHTAIQEYEALLDAIEKTITPDFSNRMIARTLEHMDTLFENIKTFQKAARIVTKGARASEVIGTMLGGLYLLGRTDRITPERAEAWVREHDWTSHTIINEETDPMRLVQYLASALARYEAPGASARTISIGDLIVLAAKGDSIADKILRYTGIAVKGNDVIIASRSQALEKVLKETDWAIKWSRMLANVDGAKQFSVFYFSAGNKTSGVSIPLSLFTGKQEAEQASLLVLPAVDEEEIPF